MKTKLWRIIGYRGKNDYDGPQDDNTNIIIAMDSRFKKEDVEAIMAYYWDKFYRSVAISAVLLKEDNK